MKNRIFLYLLISFFTPLTFAASVDIVDTQYLGYNHNRSVDYFAPVGQSFTATYGELNFINILRPIST